MLALEKCLEVRPARFPGDFGNIKRGQRLVGRGRDGVIHQVIARRIVRLVDALHPVKPVRAALMRHPPFVMLDNRGQDAAAAVLVVAGSVPFPFGPGEEGRVDGKGGIDLAIFPVRFAADETIAMLSGITIVQAGDERPGLRPETREMQDEATVKYHRAAPWPPISVAEQIGHRLVVRRVGRKNPNAHQRVPAIPISIERLRMAVPHRHRQTAFDVGKCRRRNGPVSLDIKPGGKRFALEGDDGCHILPVRARPGIFVAERVIRIEMILRFGGGEGGFGAEPGAVYSHAVDDFHRSQTPVIFLVWNQDDRLAVLMIVHNHVQEGSTKIRVVGELKVQVEEREGSGGAGPLGILPAQDSGEESIERLTVGGGNDL